MHVTKKDITAEIAQNSMYLVGHVKRKAIIVTNAQERDKQFPLLTLSLAMMGCRS
jgi:hypothetical protein